MNYFIFRNYTIEPFFKSIKASFSGYDDISCIDRAADSYIWFYFMPFKTESDTIVQEIQNYSNLIDMVIQDVKNSKPVILCTMFLFYKINYITSNKDIENAIFEYNKKLYSLSRCNSNVSVIDIGDFCKSYAIEQLIDWKYFFLSQMPLNPKLMISFSQWFVHQLNIIELKRKKCVILDLDNTLWGGILGEDGIGNIKLGEDYPGNAFCFFQSYLLALQKTGIILTISSKNNEADVMEVFKKHPSMKLKKEHFAAWRINWNNKAENIRDMAKELNIGLESMVFIDDNPSERELVKQILPEVSVPDFPAQPYFLPEFIKKITDNYFSTYKLTDEDIAKTQQYKENAERNQYKDQFVDMDAYLRSLEIVLTIEGANELNIARFAQMTQKTNQFNLTTCRYTESDIQNFIDRGDWVYGLRAKDRFGDNGITGLIIIKIDNQKAHIDTLLLSCRILGKKIENDFVAYMLEKLRKHGITEISSSYIQTAKNEQVRNFYESLNFELKNFTECQKNYELVINEKTNIILRNFFIIEEKP